MNIKEKQQVDPFKWYSMLEMAKSGVFPFCGKDIRAYRSTVHKDIERGGRSVLKPVVRGLGRGRRYLIKGSNIITFIRYVETGKISP